MAAPRNFITKRELRGDAKFRRWIRGVTAVIGQTLSDNDISGEFGDVTIAPQYVSWELILDTHNRTEVNNVRNLDPVLESAIGRKGVIVRQPTTGPLRIEVPSPRRVLVQAHELPKYPEEHGLYKVPVGVTASWKVLSLDFKRTPHLLILGATGLGGKTGALSNLIFQIARNTGYSMAKMVLVDLKGPAHEESLSRFRPLSNLLFEPIYSVSEAKDALIWVWDEMERRKQEPQPDHIFVFVDETYRLANEWGRADKFLGELAAESRSFNIHLILSTQIATQETLATTMVTQNIVSRLVGPVHSANSSAWATGRKGAGAEELQGNGDMIATLGGRVKRIQSGYVTEDSLSKLREMGRINPWGDGRGRFTKDLPRQEVVKEDAAVDNRKVDVATYADWFYENAKEGELVASQYLARKPPDEGGLGLSGPVSRRAQKYAEKNHPGS